jgi:ribosomal protein S18 acetylase RimI-like enzyme
MNVRRATQADEDALRELTQEFEQEIPEPVHEPKSLDEIWNNTLQDIRSGGVFIAEDDGGPVGFARIEAPERGCAHVAIVHVRPPARRMGVAKALLRACAEDAQARGAEFVTLEVLTSNEPALSTWRRLGFEEYAKFMATPLEALAARLAESPQKTSRATTHVQTDDEVSVKRALAQFVPRLESPEVRAGESWIRIADPILDNDRQAHGRLARELSERLGAVTVALAVEEDRVVRFRLYERGRMVDEYLSVPSYYGSLPKADELALEANPTLVSRLTGADREQIRRFARTAASPSELPPAAELYEQIARLMGLEP